MSGVMLINLAILSSETWERINRRNWLWRCNVRVCCSESAKNSFV